WSATSRTAPSSPEITTEDGPLTAARETRSVNSTRNGATSDSDPWTATIAPPAGNACINRPRATTNRHASTSDNTPDTCAALISPIECPATKSGRIPQDSTNRNNATSNANNAGWV